MKLAMRGITNYCSILLTVGCIVIVAAHGFDRAAYYGNIAAAASRVETHGAHHRRHRPAHHHLQLQEPTRVFEIPRPRHL